MPFSIQSEPCPETLFFGGVLACCRVCSAVNEEGREGGQADRC